MTETSSVTKYLPLMKKYHSGAGARGEADLFLFNLLVDQLVTSINETPALVTDKLIAALCDLALNHVHPNAKIAEKMANRSIYLLVIAACACPAKSLQVAESLEHLAVQLMKDIPPSASLETYRKGYTSMQAVHALTTMLDIYGDTQASALVALRRLALENPDARLRYDAQQALHDRTVSRHCAQEHYKKANQALPREIHQDLLTTDINVLMQGASDSNEVVQKGALKSLINAVEYGGTLLNEQHLRSLVPVFEQASARCENKVNATDLYLAARRIEKRLKK